MKEHDATEQAYKRGYEDGKRDAVKRGHWIEKEDPLGDTYFDCSVCGESFCFIEGEPYENSYLFCPNCGADMRGK